MSFGNIYSVDVQSAFSDDALGAIESAIAAECGMDDVHYPKIVKCDMRSASKFTVAFNHENLMEAVRMPSGEYGVCYEGGISQIRFSEETTLTWMQVEWAHAGKVVFPAKVPLAPEAPPEEQPDASDDDSAVLGKAILGKMILGKE